MWMCGPLWPCLALMWVGSCSAHSLFTCEPIKVHRCSGMPYNMTFFPNMMEHYDQDIAASNMEQIKVRLLSNGELIERESRTSTGEKQGRLLSEGRAQAPETRALCQTGFQKKKSIE
ncbi:hypothetical protein F7725_018897 [Dissostichus mawsoni]|uniref:FZ domain-containing protein n=1 Tax=Dissostichus mawsoni TaxID=36200 RepID=A0A7J5XSV8_DISMA|nr:hypothetical protein F7725_018897 [Dissostichus mawsoni]